LTSLCGAATERSVKNRLRPIGSWTSDGPLASLLLAVLS
jgi:hypothetical protein